MKNAVKVKPLSDAQLMVLQIVKQCSDHDLDDLRQLLFDFNERKMQQHLDATILSKGYNTTTFNSILKNQSKK